MMSASVCTASLVRFQDWQGCVYMRVCEYVRLKETERGESAHVHLTLWGPSSSTYLSLSLQSLNGFKA